MKGKLIVIDGLDGSGKATQSDLLLEEMEKSGRKVMKISLPDYDSPSSEPVKMYLNGKLGKNPDDVNPYAASSFFAVDRFISYTRSWKEFYNNGGIIIADRYTTSNAIHQCSKLPRDKWDDFIKWLFEYEYEYMQIPEPDMVIYLRLSPELSQELLEERYKDGNGKKDIHEVNPEYLRRSRKSVDYCTEKFGWSVIECEENGEIRSIEDIHADLMKAVGEL
ncbi:MAG: deoxynucleoside kinase [Ruminococcus sp.]|nr:deoxynucleoside kinase [Ruminococcus sp.]